MHDHRFELRPIGSVESPLNDRALAPKQGDEGAPDVWLQFNENVAAGLADLEVGSEVILLTWLDRANRDVLVAQPRGSQDQPAVGVFVSRSPDRPNPIGLHTVHILAIEGLRIQVRNLEALNGTPILDIKSVLAPIGER